MARVTLEHLRKVFPDSGFVAVHDLELDVQDGEFVVLVGPSGCGKSTTLRMIAGLESISSGQLSIGGRVVNTLPPKERDVAMVFQGYALYPHMTVYENMAFALTLRKRAGPDIRARVTAVAELLGLTDVLGRRPRQLSGGQRQRVAIGRAIVREPQVFLFDEPLSNLDAQLRSEMRREIAALQRTLHATTIYVTHDQVEAMTLGDRIVVLDRGFVQQIDAPLTLYHHPVNRFVASFIGSPPMNLVDGRLEADPSAARGGGLRFVSTDGAVVLPLPSRLVPATEHATPQGVTLGVRPEHLTVGTAASVGDRTGTPSDVVIAGVLDAVELLGYESVVHVTVGGVRLTARAVPGTVPAIGTSLGLRVDTEHAHLFDRATGAAVGHG
jgi:multiple sugar transport system ATP-binding protein